MTVANPKLSALSDADRELLESCLVDFDRSWDENRLADQARRLPAAGTPWRLPALIELIKIDLERQWQRGRQPTVETYLEAYPELGGPDAIPADLILAECEVRKQFGRPASFADFSRRFPRQADELRRLLEQVPDTVSDSGPAESGVGTLQPSLSTVSTNRPAGTPGSLPEQFGRYRIIKRLGKGGMGAVYLAHDGQLERDVALKVPYFVSDDDPEILQRFHREARAAAGLHHPNLCPVHDVGEIDGIHFLTMGYISGPSLAEYAQSHRPLPQAEAAAVVRKVALALAQAHRQGVMHRDLKPSNIMFDAGGEPVVMDFGLARRFNKGDERLTKSGALMGTPAYMSPEQVNADGENVGPASDIYSLGVILYELLAGRIPFQGSMPSVLWQIASENPEPPSAHRRDLDRRLEVICLKAMAKKPTERYASMDELAAALGDYLHAAPPQVGKAPPPPRRRWLVAAAAAAAAAVLLGVVLYVTTNKGTVKIEVDDKDAVVRVDGNIIGIEKLGEPISLSAGDHDLVVTRGDLVVHTRKFVVRRGKNDEAVRVELLEPKEVGGAGELPGQKGVVGAGDKKTVCEGHAGAVTSVTFSADGRRMISGAEDKTVRHWDVETGKELSDSRFKSNASVAERFLLAPDGRRFLYQSMAAVQLGDVDTNKELKHVYVATVPGKNMAFARNGRRVIVGAENAGAEAIAWVWDLETDKEVRFMKHTRWEKIQAVALSADGKVGVSAAKDGVRLWEVDTGKERWHLERPSVTALTVSADGRFVVSGSMLGTVLLHDAATGKEVGGFEGHTSAVTSIVFSTDGRRLLTGSADKTVRLWDVETKKELRRFEGHTRDVLSVALSPDGRRAASGGKDKTVRLWDITDGK